MKIVINAYSARQGGGQTYVKNLLANLPDDVQMEVLVFAPASLTLPVDARVRRVGTKWPVDNPLLRTLWEKWRLPAFLRREHVDILFCPGGVVATRPPRGCKVVTTFQNMQPFDAQAISAVPWGFERLRLIALRRVLLQSLRQSDLTIFISDYARGTIEAMARIPNPITVPHGIPEAFRADGAQAQRPAALGDEPYMLYVSKFDVYKHHAEVVQGYAMIPSELKARTRLILVGETNHPNAQRTRALIDELGLSGRVIIHGSVAYDDLPAMYQNAAANIFASSCENCPNILLEALAAGRPVLSSDVPPMPEFGGEAVVYFSPFDPRSVARAIEHVLTDPAAANLGAAALSRSRNYDWIVSAGRTWRAMANLLPSHRSAATAENDGHGRARSFT